MRELAWLLAGATGYVACVVPDPRSVAEFIGYSAVLVVLILLFDWMWGCRA